MERELLLKHDPYELRSKCHFQHVELLNIPEWHFPPAAEDYKSANKIHWCSAVVSELQFVKAEMT